MPYSQFQSIAEVQELFGLHLDVTLNCGAVPRVEPSALLTQSVRQNLPLALGGGTEKARSEFLVAPILSEVWECEDHSIAVFSGAEFNVEPARGLSGACDFIISRSRDFAAIRAPVLMVVEAKRDDLDRAAGQCAAELVAAHQFNAARGDPPGPVWGAATTGTVWRFLRIEGSTLSVEYREYYIGDLPQLLGILLHIVAAPVTPPTTGESRS